MEVVFTESGYLVLPASIVAEYFPTRLLLALRQKGELWILPVRGNGAGGLLLKQRNKKGDCSVLIWEVFPEGMPRGVHRAVWDHEKAALRIKIPRSEPGSSD